MQLKLAAAALAGAIAAMMLASAALAQDDAVLCGPYALSVQSAAGNAARLGQLTGHPRATDCPAAAAEARRLLALASPSSPPREATLPPQPLGPVASARPFQATITDGPFEIVFTREAARDGFLNGIVSADGRRLAAGGYDERVRIWDLTSERLIATIPRPGWIEGLAFTPDGENIIVSNRGGGRSITTWDVNTARLIREVQVSGGARQIAASNDGRYLAGCSSVYSLDMTTQVSVLQFPGCEEVAFVGDGNGLLVASQAGDVALHEASTGRAIWHVDAKVSAPNNSNFPNSASLNPSGDTVAIGRIGGSVELRSVTSGAVIRSFSPPGRGWTHVTFSPDGRYLVVAREQGGPIVLDSETGRVIQRLGDFGDSGGWRVDFVGNFLLVVYTDRIGVFRLRS